LDIARKSSSLNLPPRSSRTPQIPHMVLFFFS
jgi:hypothetical protein